MAQPLFKIRLFYPCGIFKSNFKDVRRLRNQRRLNPYLFRILSNTGLFFYLFNWESFGNHRATFVMSEQLMKNR